MRCTALTVLFFALFALFSTMAYAAPVAPQGAILHRQQCGMYSCKDVTGPPAGSGSTDSSTVIGNIIAQLLALMGNNNTPTDDPTTVVTASSSSPAPASDPTGTPQSVPTIRWFTETAIPSHTPLGV
ncbi:hypothetical protein F5888DRAFT_1906520 [Russula emetica]|nr:hypothetical protein F5888DRAFT_1906520 [Russula emetica]